LVKKFGDFTAVNDVSLAVRRGEMYGFLGPNGAGKTTTLLLLLGILKPTSGAIHIFGRSLAKDAFWIKQRIGVIAEDQSFYDEMTALEYLRFFGKLYRVVAVEKQAQALLERLDLWQWRDGIIGAFSTGMRKKLGFARALLHSPDLLILVEPVSGLDPHGIVQVRELLLEAKQQGATVLLSSHVLSEVERIADRVGILAAGRLAAEDTMTNLERRVSGQQRIEVELVEAHDDLAQKLETLPYVRRVEREQSLLTVYTANDRDYRADLGRALAEQRAVIQAMRSIKTSLEEVFITITEAHVNRWIGESAHGH
jgi:ABC-2 type transport system ATP-binding protein